jgi:hypothetical protein
MVTLNYDEALRYFDVDAENTDFLNSLDEDEVENLVVRITINHNKKWVTWEMGHRFHDSEHLGEIDNIGIPEEDDYVGACEKLHEMDEDLGLGMYHCEYDDADFEYRLPWQQTCEVCGRTIDDDQIVHMETV